MAFSNYPLLGLGIFFNYHDAEVALDQLKRLSLPTSQLSFLAKASDRHDELSTASSGEHYASSLPSASNPIPEGTTLMLERLEDLVPHPVQVSSPGIGPVIAGGRLSSILSNPSWDTFKGSLVEAFKVLGIPEESAQVYSDRINRGDCLIMVEGSSGDIQQSENILRHCEINEWNVYQATTEPRLSDKEPAAHTLVQDHETLFDHPLAAAPIAPSVAPAASNLSNPTSEHTSSMQNDYQRHAIGVFQDYSEAAMALQDLQQAGFPMDCISVIAPDDTPIASDHPNTTAGLDVADAGHPQVGKGAKTGALAGGTLGGLTGLLVGLGTLAIPGVGPILLAGATATAIATTLAGGAIGAAAGGLVGAMTGLGIPEDRAQVYSDRLAQGNYIVMVTGTEAEIRRAEKVLQSRGIEEWGIYEIPSQVDRPNYYSGDVVDYENTLDARRDVSASKYQVNRNTY
ncbi:MAG: hypothetical protein VKK04_26220 [Synechococcales bacterium]|nr:hypothetical protein [Synechococcales bacterium]